MKIKISILTTVLIALGAFLFFKKDLIQIPLGKEKSLTWEFTIGDHSIYKTSQVSDIKFQSQGPDTSTTRLEIEGKYHEKVYAVTEKVILLGISFHDMEIKNVDDPKLKALKKSLEKEIFVKVSPLRKVKNFFIPEKYPPEGLNILKSIFLTTQIVLPSSAVNSWQSQEMNMTGPYLAEYELKDNKTIAKNLLAFDFTLSDVEIDSDIYVLPDSEILVSLSDNRINILSHVDATLVKAQGINIYANIKTNLTLLSFKNDSSIKSISLDDQYWAQNKFYQAQVFGGEIDPEERKRVLKNRVGDLTPEDIFEKLKTLDFEKDGAKSYDLFRKLSALLELDPRDISKVIDQINGLNETDPFYEDFIALYFGAISSMESKYAADELINLIKENENSSKLLQAFGALGDLRNPSPKTKDFLITSFQTPSNQDIKSLSALTLGTLGKMSGVNSPRLSSEATQFLVEELSKASTNEEKLTLVAALGNSGNIEALNSLKPLMNSENDDLLRVSIMAMENMSGKEVNSLIDKLLISNSLSTKESAVIVLAGQSPSKFQFNHAKKLFNDDKHPELRIEALKIINDNSGLFEKEAMEILKTAKEKDQDRKIREAAYDLLLTQ